MDVCGGICGIEGGGGERFVNVDVSEGYLWM